MCSSDLVLFTSKLGESAVRKKLEQQLHDYTGKPVGVLIRSAAEMAQVLADNPFPEAPGNRVVAIFLDEAPPAHALDDIKHRKQERLACGKREIYVHYADGIAHSRLTIPAARAGTARNINTIAKLAQISASR